MPGLASKTATRFHYKGRELWPWVSCMLFSLATVRCLGGCACAVQTIDAHKTDAHRNVSVFLQHVS